MTPGVFPFLDGLRGMLSIEDRGKDPRKGLWDSPDVTRYLVGLLILRYVCRPPSTGGQSGLLTVCVLFNVSFFWTWKVVLLM